MTLEQRNGGGMVQAVLEEDEAAMLCGKRIRRGQFGGWETSGEAVQARNGKG